MIRNVTLTKVTARSSWPDDFYTLLTLGMPSEFKNCGTAMRGLYMDKIVAKWYMKPTIKPARNTYEISFDKYSVKEGFTMQSAIADMIEDICGVAKKNGFTRVKTPQELVQNTFLLGRSGFDLIVMSQM